jgi:hypothetical protein
VWTNFTCRLNMQTPSLLTLWHTKLSLSRITAMTVAARPLKLAGLPCQCGLTQKGTLLKHGFALSTVMSSLPVCTILLSPSKRAMSTPLSWTQVQPAVVQRTPFQLPGSGCIARFGRRQ